MHTLSQKALEMRTMEKKAFFLLVIVGGSLFVGALWVLMTLAFDFLFGYFVADRSWSTLLDVFDISGGNLFTLVLLVSLFSPYVAFRMKGTP